MTAYKIAYLVLILISMTSCKTNRNSEEEILSSIFPQLVDSLHIKWIPIPPPSPPPIGDNDSNFIGGDSTKLVKIFVKYQKYLDRLDSIDSRILIGIEDTNFLIDWNDLKSRTYGDDDYVNQFILNNEGKTSVATELNLNQIDVSSNLELIFKSEIKKKHSNIWTTLRDRKFVGLLKISKIYLSENSDYGILQIDYYYNEWDGYSNFIIIEKIEKKWQVKKILQNWVT